MFPPLEAKAQNDFLSEYSTFNYWRDDLPDIKGESNVEPPSKDEPVIVQPST
jgi:hypothetical protein